MGVIETKAPLQAPSVTKVQPQPATGAPAPKEAKVKVPKPPRKTLWGRLKEEYAKGSSVEQILQMVKAEFPNSDFNGNSAFHYRYYRGKFNMEARAEGTAETTSPKWPSAPRAPRAPKPEAACAIAGQGVVKTIAQPAKA